MAGSRNAPSAMGTDSEEDTCVKERDREIRERERERKKEIREEVLQDRGGRGDYDLKVNPNARSFSRKLIQSKRYQDLIVPL